MSSQSGDVAMASRHARSGRSRPQTSAVVSRRGTDAAGQHGETTKSRSSRTVSAVSARAAQSSATGEQRWPHSTRCTHRAGRTVRSNPEPERDQLVELRQELAERDRDDPSDEVVVGPVHAVVHVE